jgi:hypothetical protein
MRNSLRTLLLVLFCLVLIVGLGGGLFWGNLKFVRAVPAGVDFFGLWKPAQNLIMQGVMPYDQVNTLQVQRWVYGRAALAAEQSYQFNMPFYVILLVLPVGWIGDFAIARTLWMVALELVSVGLAGVALQLSGWRPSWFILLLAALFGLFWAPGALSILHGSLVLFQALLVFGAIRALAREADELAGAFLALGLMYISVTGLSILLIGIWVVSLRRWRVLAGFLMTLTVLGAISFLVSPSWFSDFFFSILRTWREHALPSTFTLLEGWFPGLGVQLGQAVRALAIIGLFFEWQAVRGKGTPWLFWTTGLTAVLTPYFGLRFSPVWLAFTLPAVLLVFSVMGQRWGLFGHLMAFITLAGVFIGLWVAELAVLESVFLFIYPLFMTIMLYWVRWWVTRPPRLWIDMIAQEN